MEIKIIKEITEQLDCGFQTFIHKTTGQLLFVPDDSNYPDIDLNLWDKELELLENNFSEYFEIDKWTSNEAFKIMSEYSEQLTENNLQNQLFEALKKSKPFREFKHVINNSGEFRQKWFCYYKK